MRMRTPPGDLVIGGCLTALVGVLVVWVLLLWGAWRLYCATFAG